jgi:hypothetical protein
MPVPPDEILVSRRTVEPSLQNADFVQHRTHKTLSELRELGYKVPDDIVDDEDASTTIEDMARATDTSAADLWTDPTQNRARRLVLFKESYPAGRERRRHCRASTHLPSRKEPCWRTMMRT